MNFLRRYLRKIKNNRKDDYFFKFFAKKNPRFYARFNFVKKKQQKTVKY